MAGRPVKIHVGVPWRGGDAHRERSFRYVCDHLHSCGLTALPADSGHEPFSRAGSRNTAVRHAADADVVFLHDADMILPDYQAAAELALETDEMVVAFRHYHPLDRSTTDAVLGGADPFTATPIDVFTDFSVGGVIALTPAAYWRIGGQNERYEGWGYEDSDFARSAESAGTIHRIDQPGVHLWHPTETTDRNLDLFLEAR